VAQHAFSYWVTGLADGLLRKRPSENPNRIAPDDIEGKKLRPYHAEGAAIQDRTRPVQLLRRRGISLRDTILHPSVAIRQRGWSARDQRHWKSVQRG
jgi:hypothetical protein